MPPFNIATLGAKGSLQLTRPTLFTHIATQEACQVMAAELFAMVTSGKVTIRIDQRFPLAEVAAAHRRAGGAGDHRLHDPDGLRLDACGRQAQDCGASF